MLFFVFCFFKCTVSLLLLRRWCRYISKGRVGGSGGVSQWFRPLLLISQSGKQRVLKLHNNLLSSSGGSVYLTKCSQGCRILFCVLLSFFAFLVLFLWLFFFYLLCSRFFLFFCNPVMKPPGHWQPACSDCNPSVRTLTSCASAIYCNIHCTTVAWQVWSGCDDESGDLATRSEKSHPLLSSWNLPLVMTSYCSRTAGKYFFFLSTTFLFILRNKKTQSGIDS